MSINFGAEYRKFYAEQEKLRTQYRELGMSEKQIKAMYEFDLEALRSDNRYKAHSCPLEIDPEEALASGKNKALRRFLEALSVYMTPWQSAPHAWVEEIGNEGLVRTLKKLSDDDLELLNRYVMLEQTQRQIGEAFGISQKGVSKRIARLRKKFLKNF